MSTPNTPPLTVLTLLIFTGVGITLLADVVLKKSAGHNPGLIFLGFILYATVAIPVAIAFRLTNFGNLFLLWEAATVVAGIIVATLLYREQLTFTRLLALGLVLAGMLLSGGQR